MRRRLSFLVSMLFLMNLALIYGQGVGARLEGLVRDQSQAVIPGVAVTATHDATNIGHNAVSNEAGRYVFVALPPGTYTVSVELPGFKKMVRSGVILQIGDARTADFTLEPGGIEESITVVAEAPLMDLTTTKVGSVVETRQIGELPLDGRNAMMLFYLAGGTNPKDRLGAQQQTGMVDGLAPHTSNVKVEGIFSGNAGYDYTPAHPNTPVPQEALGEYRITTSGSSADAGRGSGAKVSVFLKSGTNEFHGSVFEFNRDTVLAANNFFNNRTGQPRPDIKRNQFGFSLGGPIIRNKTFFFGTIEWQRQREGVIQNRNVYTPALRQGIFRHNLQGQNSASNVDPNTGTPRVPYGEIDLLSVDSTRLGMDTFFLPELLAAMPAPNNYDVGDGFNIAGYRYTWARPNDGQTWLLKLDHELTSRHRVAASYSTMRFRNPQPALYTGLSAEDFIEIRRGGSLRLLSTFTPRLSNELSVGANLRHSIRPITNPSQETPRGNIMLTGLGNGNIHIDRAYQSNPAVNLGFSDNFSWLTGNHTVSFGGELYYQMMNRTVSNGWPQIRTQNSSNPANIPARPGLHSSDRSRAQQLTNDLTGSIGTITQSFFLNSLEGYVPYAGNYQQLRQLEWATYIHDIWKVRPNLSLNLGLRHEMLHPGWIADGVFAYPVGGVDGALGVQGPAGKPTEWGFAPDKGRGIMRTDWNNFAPTVGFSWDPFGRGDTSLSGSYGISYDRSMMVVYGGFSASNYGANTQVTITPFTRMSDPNLYRSILPIPTPEPFAPLGFTRESRAYAVDPDIATPYVQSWTLRISRQVGLNWKVDVAYIGNHAVGQWRAENLNQIEIRRNGFLDAFKIAQRNLAQNGSPVRGESLGSLQSLFELIPSSQNSLISEGQAAALANFLDTTTLLTNVRGGLVERAGLPNTFFRFNPQVQNLNVVGNRTHSTWNGMKLSVQRRLSSGIYVQGNYTLSKGFTDYIPEQTLTQDYRDNANIRLDKALNPDDSTHVLSVNWIYEVPVGNGRMLLGGASGPLDMILGGWQINGIYNYATGSPLEITTGRETLSLESSTPNFTGKAFHLSKVTKGELITTLTTEQKSQFSNPGAGEPGHLPLRSFRGPAFANLDLSLFKKFPLPFREQTEVQFRLEFFNALNQVNFNDPAVNINNGNFGVISSARSARVGQVALKFIF